MNMIFAMNEGTIPFNNFLEHKIESISKAGFSGIGIWDRGISDYLSRNNNLSDLSRILGYHNLRVIEINYLKDWANVRKDRKEGLIYGVQRLCDFGKALHADCITVAAFGKEIIGELAIENFRLVCDEAAKYDLKVALEFLPWQEIATLNYAWKIISSSGVDNGGLLIDTFHFFKGGSQFTDLYNIPVEKIFVVHVNDFAFKNNHYDLITQTRSHRVFPGQGDFDLIHFLGHLHKRGYVGPVSLEILSDYFNDLSVDEISKIGFDSLRQLIEQAIKESESLEYE